MDTLAEPDLDVTSERVVTCVACSSTAASSPGRSDLQALERRLRQPLAYRYYGLPDALARFPDRCCAVECADGS